MLAPLSPLAAYRLDLERVRGRQAFSSRDGDWLAFATVLTRLASLAVAARSDFATRAAASLASAQHARLSPDLRIARALQAYGTTGDHEPIAHDTQREVEGLEEAGAFALAYSVLHALAQLLEDGPEPLRGRTIAQMGRVARQAGELEQAMDLYATAAAMGRRLGDPDLVCRATMGKGVVANMRGNYPQARATFKRVLATARRHNFAEVVAAAHHGLMRGALAAGDPDTALVHGWEAFRQPSEHPDRRAEMLANLAETCAVAGQYRAALAGYRAAAAMTTLTRVRLAALGGAVVAAAALGDGAELEKLTSETETEIASSDQPYEIAQSVFELATAWLTFGSRARADGYRARALFIARRHGFKEVAYRAEELMSSVAAETSPPPPLGPRSAAVIRSIERLDWRACVESHPSCR